MLQKDTFSCGLLAFNALAHHILPSHYPLIPTTSIVKARLEILLGITKCHFNQNFASITKGYQFTFTVEMGSELNVLDQPSSIITSPTSSPSIHSAVSLPPLSDTYLSDSLQNESENEVNSDDHPSPGSEFEFNSPVPDLSSLQDSKASTPPINIALAVCNTTLAAKRANLPSTTSAPTPAPAKKKMHVEKVHRASAIHDAIQEMEQGHPQGMMQFVKPVTKDEFHQQMKKLDATLDEQRKNLQDHNEMVEMQQKMKKSRQAKYDAEIACGECSPGGRKKNLKVCKADETKSNDTPQSSWRTILPNGKVMWSTLKLVNYLKAKDPVIFKGLAQSTIEGWIDHSGQKPQWSVAAI
ncbi:hypothetical protein PAXRUDRAFT_28870 [Paxillus rubicundulus Ve08.2h10]|uniref:Ubiquitin-like protease family profile domain-containing protein n=1 Tax=Paxillus rubicundulus Ve08.2h10 TaxID=930991 RepID=A0A0D0C1H0_9AGAM|nr:hypothetical protein PAXRUDRAFT_28870 [Paxillus rubicundulus Ve08.2h10]